MIRSLLNRFSESEEDRTERMAREQFAVMVEHETIMREVIATIGIALGKLDDHSAATALVGALVARMKHDDRTDGDIAAVLSILGEMSFEGFDSFKARHDAATSGNNA